MILGGSFYGATMHGLPPTRPVSLFSVGKWFAKYLAFRCCIGRENARQILLSYRSNTSSLQNKWFRMPSSLSALHDRFKRAPSSPDSQLATVQMIQMCPSIQRNFTHIPGRVGSQAADKCGELRRSNYGRQGHADIRHHHRWLLQPRDTQRRLCFQPLRQVSIFAKNNNGYTMCFTFIYFGDNQGIFQSLELLLIDLLFHVRAMR